MRQATPELRDLARRLLAREVGDSRDPGQVVAAAERIFQKLDGPVRQIVGRAGLRSLLGRAVDLSAAEFPQLEAIGGEAQKEDFLKGLHSVSSGRDPGETAEAVSAILANFLWLLVTFVGPNLAVRLVSGVWPDLSPGDLQSGSSKGDGDER